MTIETPREITNLNADSKRESRIRESTFKQRFISEATGLKGRKHRKPIGKLARRKR